MFCVVCDPSVVACDCTVYQIVMRSSPMYRESSPLHVCIYTCTYIHMYTRVPYICWYCAWVNLTKKAA